MLELTLIAIRPLHNNSKKHLTQSNFHHLAYSHNEFTGDVMLVRNTKGFSLIELMIVAAIISILATIAIPSYQHYTKRARFIEVISAAQIYKIAVALALQQGIPLNELTNGKYGIPDSPKNIKNVKSILVENGIITAISTQITNEATYILKPNTEGDVWTVSGSCLKQGLCHA